MKCIKVCLLLIGFCSAQLVQAATTQKLYCASGLNGLYAAIVTDTDYVSLKDVHLLGAFTYADLTCSASSTLTQVQCSGYLNDRIFIAGTFSQLDDQSITFSYSSPTNHTVKSVKPWICTVE